MKKENHIEIFSKIFFKNNFLFIIVFGFFIFLPAMVFASDYGLSATAGATGLKKQALPELIGAVIGSGLALIGVLFFGLMIYGGILWMSARGNQETTKKALDTIVAAIIGLIVILSSYAITNFVFRSVEEAQPEGGSGAGTVPLESGMGTDLSGYLTGEKVSDCPNANSAECPAGTYGLQVGDLCDCYKE